MSVSIGQTYKDLDPRMEGRTLRVTAINHSTAKVLLEVVSNPSDVENLLRDETPGTRNYQPEDRVGETTKISLERLVDEKLFSRVEDAPDVSGPQG